MINKIKKIESLIFEIQLLLSELKGEDNFEITKTPKVKRKARLPDDLTISEAMIAYAKLNNIANIENEFERFKNYHISKGTLFADIERAWKTWVSNAITFRSPNIQQPHEIRKLVL